TPTILVMPTTTSSCGWTNGKRVSTTMRTAHERQGLSAPRQSARGGRSARVRLAFRLGGDGQDPGSFGARAASAASAGYRSVADPVPDLHQGRRGGDGGAGQRRARAMGA